MGGACQRPMSAITPSRSSVSMSPYTYARPSPSWPGERSTWAIARGERNKSVGPAPLLGGTLPPSQNSIAKGRSGSARSISRQRDSVPAGTGLSLPGAELPQRRGAALVGARRPLARRRARRGKRRADVVEARVGEHQASLVLGQQQWPVDLGQQRSDRLVVVPDHRPHRLQLRRGHALDHLPRDLLVVGPLGELGD